MFDGILNNPANINMDMFAATINPICFTEIRYRRAPIQDILVACVQKLLIWEYIIPSSRMLPS